MDYCEPTCSSTKDDHVGLRLNLGMGGIKRLGMYVSKVRLVERGNADLLFWLLPW